MVTFIAGSEAIKTSLLHKRQQRANGSSTRYNGLPLTHAGRTDNQPKRLVFKLANRRLRRTGPASAYSRFLYRTIAFYNRCSFSNPVEAYRRNQHGNVREVEHYAFTAAPKVESKQTEADQTK
jgi:hypothetical protein